MSVIREKDRRRASCFSGDDPDEWIVDQWLTGDVPFIDELCLVFLVALRHHVERCLIHFAARAAYDGRPIDRERYKERMDELPDPKDKHKKRWDWNKIQDTSATQP